MTDYHAAIGRDVGKVDTDSGGLARYSLRLQLPPGITHDTEPELSLEYCQGTPNGSLGVGWALGGLSCIRQGPSNLPYDGFNTRPANYDRFKPKYTLDGAELLNISGDYDSPDAQYSTEIEGVSRVVSVHGSGFLVRDATGRRAEYGTSDDSRVVATTTGKVREWRLKNSTDYHSNTITYNYVTTPVTGGAAKDVNTCYLSSIRYTSNERAKHLGSRIVKFEYSARPDLVVQTVQGDKCTWASLLTAVRIGAASGNDAQIHRSYSLMYDRSPFTGDSRLVSVTESSSESSNKINLLPSTFGYTAPGASKQDFFKSVPRIAPIKLLEITDTVAMFTMNISGRCLADLACVQYEKNTNQMSIKTFLADFKDDGTVSWNPSEGPAAEAKLPLMNMKNGFPSILSPDMNNDGRSDLIIPYANSDNRITFSISQCVGTGFQNSRTKETDFVWANDSKFIALDLSGAGTVDIVQIFSGDAGKLTFRSFAGLNQNGEIGLKDAVVSVTEYDNVGTIDWCQLSHAGTGAKSLVRIWEQTNRQTDQTQLKATTFALNTAEDSSKGFKAVTTSLLGAPTQTSDVKQSVLTCDINADGTQDIVLAQAEYHDGKMFLSFNTYLGDGFGGFTKHGETVTKTPAVPAPINAKECGTFHMTNLNGSNYPSLSFVYQENTSRNYTCLAIDGRSDGLFGEPIAYTLAEGDMPAPKMEIMAVDINGNGMGDWLFYTIENATPTVVPVYNRATIADFLAWAQDSMGLRTNLTYGCLSDPNVYTPGVDWRNYSNNSTDSYPVIAAPNYVVTQLEHRNDQEINSLAYKVLIKKTYANARINFLGRGWQGFNEINTVNVIDGISTTEKYSQTWPITGSKLQVDIKPADGKVLLKSIKTNYESTFTAKGPWKIYRVNRTLEQTDMLDDDKVVRTNATLYKYDQNGNMILQSPSETQLGKLMYQSWNRCSYTTIDGVSNVLTCKKVSGSEKNVDMTMFESGDCSLTLYENDTARAILKSASEWSTDTESFSKKLVEFNEFGKEIRSLDAAGLERIIFYDDVFKSFPVKIVEKAPNIESTELTAFDSASGLEVARRERNGLLTCYGIDDFGRICETRAQASEPSKNTVSATKFLATRTFVSDPALSTLLSTAHLDPQRTISFERQKSPSGAAYLALKINSYSKDGVKGQHEFVDYVDCVKQVRKRSSRDADDTDKLWLYWEFDTGGQYTFESFPTKVPAAGDLDWVPDRSLGVRMTNDTLGRLKSRLRPAHGAQGRFVLTSMAYLDGGAKIQEKTLSTMDTSAPFASAALLTTLERRYLHLGKEDLIIGNVDENGLRSTFQYDNFGRLVQSTDAAGQIETRSYNSSGDVVTFDSVYQNVAHVAGVPAIANQFNAARQLVRQTNAAKEAITYQRDAKGRPLTRTGADGRTLKYVYDTNGYESTSSVTIFPNGVDGKMESSFEFTYDQRGRIRDRKLTLADGSSFTTTSVYDWQDRVVEKTRPDGAVLTHDYRGSEVASSTLSTGTGDNTTWFLKAETAIYSPFGRPEKLTLQGTGIKDAFLHEWKYDSQGFPLNHSLATTNKTLVQEEYTYNDLDKVVRTTESVSGNTTDYTYAGMRLATSQVKNGATNSYAYDAAGSLINKGDISIQYQPGHALGTKDGKTVFDISYDGVGRVSKRSTNSSNFGFNYDSLGALKSLQDTGRNVSVNFLSDFEGEMLQRTHSDGSSDLFVSDDFSFHVSPDGIRTARHQFANMNNSESSGHVLANVTNVVESTSLKPATAGTRAVSVYFADTKGNVTHIFKGEDAVLREKMDYDDFGSLDPGTVDALKDDVVSTFEGNFLDKATSLVNFKGRFYDPLVGRFVTPDNILNIGSLVRTDGLNRYAFENNDPINNVDPTGHWSWSGVLGTIVSVGLIVAAVGVSVATGGAAAPLAAAAVGALVGGGVAGLFYSVKHKDEDDAGKFWAGFGTTVAINAAIGAATGAAGTVATPARLASATARLAVKAAIGGVSSVLNKAADRGVDNVFYGQHHDLFEGAARTFMMGALAAGALSAVGGGGKGADAAGKGQSAGKITQPFKLTNSNLSTGAKQAFEPKPGNPWAGLTKEMLKTGAKSTLKPGGKIASWGAQELGLDQKAMEWAKGSH